MLFQLAVVVAVVVVVALFLFRVVNVELNWKNGVGLKLGASNEKPPTQRDINTLGRLQDDPLHGSRVQVAAAAGPEHGSISWPPAERLQVVPYRGEAQMSSGMRLTAAVSGLLRLSGGLGRCIRGH